MIKKRKKKKKKKKKEKLDERRVLDNYWIILVLAATFPAEYAYILLY